MSLCVLCVRVVFLFDVVVCLVGDVLCDVVCLAFVVWLCVMCVFVFSLLNVCVILCEPLCGIVWCASVFVYV